MYQPRSTSTPGFKSLRLLLMNENPFNSKVQNPGLGPLHSLEGVEPREDGATAGPGGALAHPPLFAANFKGHTCIPSHSLTPPPQQNWQRQLQCRHTRNIMPVQGPTNFFFKGPESKQILDLAGSLYPNLLFREKQPQKIFMNGCASVPIKLYLK